MEPTRGKGYAPGVKLALLGVANALQSLVDGDVLLQARDHKSD